MANPLIDRYPEDLTGTLPGNLILNEEHTLPAQFSRSFALFVGPFFEDSVVVRREGSATPLIKGTDYIVEYIYPRLVKRTGGKSVKAVITMRNASIIGKVYVDYQVVGGDSAYSIDAILNLIGAIGSDGRSVYYADVLNKPIVFPPARHLHPGYELFGFVDLINAIDVLTQQSQLNSTELQSLMTSMFTAMGNRLTTMESTLSTLSPAIDANNAKFWDLHGYFYEMYGYFYQLAGRQSAIETALLTVQDQLLTLQNSLAAADRFTPIQWVSGAFTLPSISGKKFLTATVGNIALPPIRYAPESVNRDGFYYDIYISTDVAVQLSANKTLDNNTILYNGVTSDVATLPTRKMLRVIAHTSSQWIVIPLN